MKHLATFILCFLLIPICRGQEMPLSQCISTGIANNLSLANARIGIDKARTGLSQNRSRLLPVINGIFQFTDYLKSPVNVTTGTLLGNDFPDDPTWQTIRSMQFNATAGIQLSMPLYNQTILAAIDVAKTVERISSLSYEKAADDLTVQISAVYYMAQASLEQVRLADENILRMEELCNITEALYEQGVVMEVDVNRVRINLKSLKAQRGQSHTLHCQQLNMLRFLMDMAPEKPLEVTRMEDDIAPLHTNGPSTQLPELLLSAQQKTLAKQHIRAAKARRLPTLSLTGYAGALGYQEKFSHFFHTKAATDNWFSNCYVGLTLRVPLFEANSTKLQIEQCRHDARQAANNMELTQKQLSENYANAMLQLNNNVEIFRTQSESRRQAEEVRDVTEEQYKEGVASMTALLQDEMNLRTAQTACVQALLQCRMKQLDLLKLSGNLSQLSR